MHRPSIFVIVLDCVSSTAIQRASEQFGPLRAIDSFASASVSFEGATTTSPWTIPAHASLFTGLYPWTHGLHNFGARRLNRNIPTVATFLAANGYRTFSLSANPFISPNTGLTRGFDIVAWGSFADCYLRAIRSALPLNVTMNTQDVPLSEDGFAQWMPGRRLPVNLVLRRFPILWDGATRILAKLLRQNASPRNVVAPWIEDSLSSILGQVDKDSPVFGFVNLLDAHEPFMGLPVDTAHGLDYFRAFSVREDTESWLRRRWAPSDRDLRELSLLYLSAVKELDVRLSEILATLKRFNRWNESLVILTSDHGQSFEKNHVLFHGLELTEELLRVPLYVRYPDDSKRGEKAVGQASLVDVLPTVLSEAGVLLDTLTDGVTLRSLADVERDGPVFSMSDGVWPAVRQRIPKEVRRRLDTLETVAIAKSQRTMVEPTRVVAQYSPGRHVNEGVQNLRRQEPVATTVTHSWHKPAPSQDSETDKIASWGYS